MKDHMISIAKRATLLAGIAIAAVGCTGHTAAPPQPIAAPACTLPSGHLAAPAFDTAYQTLGQQECKYAFDDILTSLLDITQGDPGEANKKRFSDLLVWSSQHNIISPQKSKELYTRYFSPRFVSLPDEEKTYLYCHNSREILNNCESELRDKKIGLLQIAKDKEAYQQVSNELPQIALILEATCTACAEE